MNQPQPIQNTERFTGKAEAYDRARPDYPAEALACIREQCRLAAGSVVADIGAGTGKLTRMLLEDGFRVHAVEPNDAMRAALQARLGHSPTLRIVGAPAEATTLEDHCVDAITVAQAFHWFDHAACKIEFARILKPGGKAALLWNNRDKDQPLTRAHGELMLKCRVREAVSIEKPHELYDSFFRSHEIFRFAYTQYLDEAALLALTFSRSYSPGPEDSEYADLESAVKNLFAKYQKDGVAAYCYRTAVVIGEVA